jgi:DNA-binding transcriptional LysR family regulator
MHPRLLKTFLAAAHNRNFTRAAAEVHLAQSSVSDQIQSLEAELGAALFIRSRHGLELTRAGQALALYAEKMLVLAEEARAAVTAAGGQEPLSIDIGALETIAAIRLPAWLSAFRGNHPGISLRLKVAGSGELLRELETGEIDIAFCFDQADLDQRFVKRMIATEPLVLVTPADEAFRNWTPGLEELSAANFLATETGCVYRAMLDRAFCEAGLGAPKLAAEVGSIGAIAQMVAAGSGIGLVPRLAIADALRRGDVRAAPWPGPTQIAPLVMIWRRRRVQPPLLRSLLAAVSEGFGS